MSAVLKSNCPARPLRDWRFKTSLDIFSACFVSACQNDQDSSRTMLSVKPQAISGVSPDFESTIEELYPSIAATGIGDFINTVLNSIPNRVWGMKVSNLLFGLPLAPLAALVYLWMKVFGSRYVVTNRAVKRMSSLGFVTKESVPLSQVTAVSVDPDSRLDFYQTGDVRLTGTGDQTLILLRGVPRPDRFCQVIREACDARRQVEAALARINARH
jgi:hypothetical protein